MAHRFRLFLATGAAAVLLLGMTAAHANVITYKLELVYPAQSDASYGSGFFTVDNEHPAFETGFCDLSSCLVDFSLVGHAQFLVFDPAVSPSASMQLFSDSNGFIEAFGFYVVNSIYAMEIFELPGVQHGGPFSGWISRVDLGPRPSPSGGCFEYSGDPSLNCVRVTVVPEPATALLVGIAVAGLAWSRRTGPDDTFR